MRILEVAVLVLVVLFAAGEAVPKGVEIVPLRPRHTQQHLSPEPILLQTDTQTQALAADGSDPRQQSAQFEQARMQQFDGKGALAGAAVGMLAGGPVGALAGAAAGGVVGGLLSGPQQGPDDIEDCVACRYIWLRVEMDVGNSQMEEHIYDSFVKACMEAQRAPIFYPACQDMFDAIDDMINDYMDGLTVNQMCENSRICRVKPRK